MVTALETSCLAPAVPALPLPASFSQPSMVSRACEAEASISDDCATMPPRTKAITSTATATSPSRISAAPPMRGTPRRWSAATPGDATAAMTPPATTGTTIVAVRPRIQTSPTSRTAMPTRSQAWIPSRRSHTGASKRLASCSRSMAGSASSASASAASPAGAGVAASPCRLQRLKLTASPSASELPPRRYQPPRPRGQSGGPPRSLSWRERSTASLREETPSFR